MEKQQALALIDGLSIREFGLFPAPLSEKIREKKEAEKLICALNNADTDGVLLTLLSRKPQAVFAGMALAADALGVQEKELYLPEYASKMEETLRLEAQMAGIEVRVGLVDVRENEKNLLCHIVTMADLGEKAQGKDMEGVYVSVNGGTLLKLTGETKLSALVENARAVQIGYALYQPDALNMTLDEAHPENGVIRAFTPEDCVPDAVQKQLFAWKKQSCGKCVFCREGIQQLEYMHREIIQGRGKAEALPLTQEIGQAMGFSCACSMGAQAARLALSAMDTVPAEYEAHIRKRKCPANVCKAFQWVYVNPRQCVGCTACMAACPVDAIDGAKGYIHVVADFLCTRCGDCIPACPEKAIVKTSASLPKLPDRMMRIGRFKG